MITYLFFFSICVSNNINRRHHKTNIIQHNHTHLHLFPKLKFHKHEHTHTSNLFNAFKYCNIET